VEKFMTENHLWALILVVTAIAYVGPMLYAQYRFTREFTRLVDQLLDRDPKGRELNTRSKDGDIKRAALLAKDLVAQVIEQLKSNPKQREFIVEFEPRTSREVAATARNILKSRGWFPVLHADGQANISASRREDVEKLTTSSADLAYKFDSEGPFVPIRFEDGSEPYVASPWEVGL